MAELAGRRTAAIRDLQTLRGFRRHTVRISQLTLAIAGIGVTSFLCAAVVLLKDLFSQPVADQAAMLTGFGAVGAGMMLAAAAVHRLLGRRLHRAYLRGGWVAVQAPTGYVLDVTGASSVVYFGPLDTDASGRIMLVSAKEQQPADFLRPLAAVRRQLAGLTELERDRLGESIRRAGLAKAPPASAFFPDAAGCLLGAPGRRTDLAVVVPVGTSHRLFPLRRQTIG
ncbi:hypothetical protein GCM10009804_73190 [Kribbella hippodromi]|uniref:Uncharacterized protein n=1 Tax=Kribbella hippodromi TaxID=434347 RepID=A0ABN2EHF3_9ACTN